MSTFGPLDHYPGILERVVNLIDLQVQMRDRPEVDAVVLWASHRIEHLYGDRTGRIAPNTIYCSIRPVTPILPGHCAV